LAAVNPTPVVLPPPDLSPLIQAQIEAAQFYIRLSLAYGTVGVCILAVPLIISVPEEFLRLALHLGGILIGAIATFPSTKYLQRRNRGFGLRMIASEYGRLARAGELASPARKQLDQLVTRVLKDML
jgi:hypothetical protein